MHIFIYVNFLFHILIEHRNSLFSDEFDYSLLYDKETKGVYKVEIKHMPASHFTPLFLLVSVAMKFFSERDYTF